MKRIKKFCNFRPLVHKNSFIKNRLNLNNQIKFSNHSNPIKISDQILFNLFKRQKINNSFNKNSLLKKNRIIIMKNKFKKIIFL